MQMIIAFGKLLTSYGGSLEFRLKFNDIVLQFMVFIVFLLRYNELCGGLKQVHDTYYFVSTYYYQTVDDMYALNNKIMRAYDHQLDEQQPKEAQNQVKGDAEGEGALELMQEDYNLAKVTSEIHQIGYQLKNVQAAMRKTQREVELKVGEAQLTQTVAMINGGIHVDPNIVKLLKTREEALSEDDNKLKMNAGLFSRKLNQMAQALSMLLTGQKRLDSRITAVESDFKMQLSEKSNELQLQLQEVRGDTNKTSMELTQRVQLSAFQLNDRMRQIETKLNWRLSEFKTKIDQKVNEESVLASLDAVQKRVAAGMRDFQLKSNIDPGRIQAIQQQIMSNKTSLQEKITQCNFLVHGLHAEIENSLVRRQQYAVSRAAVEQRLSLFNNNFNDVYKRVLRMEGEEAGIQANIKKLLTDTSYSLTQLKRINTVLLNIKISDDFQRMLEEMNPTKVLELQESVDHVKVEQNNIFREIALAKREISIVQAKSQNMGFLTPNYERQKLKKEQLDQALANFFSENHFAQKMAALQRQLAEHRHSVDAVALLSRQVARLQKQNQFHRLSFEVRSLQEYVKKELAVMASRIKEKTSLQYNNINDRPGSNSNSSINEDPLPIGQAGRSFSSKKMGSFSMRQTGQMSKQLIQLKTSRR